MPYRFFIYAFRYICSAIANLVGIVCKRLYINLHLAPEKIANLYKQRWKTELFFKWIKQRLKIESFQGKTENAVKTQVCMAAITTQF